ncbi:MAG: hypothetical protein IJZ19_05755 [Lentisphaeria bacterium]|nr:hypothetical protein [Lentisphaeria bacterium]
MLFSPCFEVIKKPLPFTWAAEAGIIALSDLPLPSAAMINNKKQANKLNKQQNKGSKQCTSQINGGVDDGDAVENLFIHG